MISEEELEKEFAEQDEKQRIARENYYREGIEIWNKYLQQMMQSTVFENKVTQGSAYDFEFVTKRCVCNFGEGDGECCCGYSQYYGKEYQDWNKEEGDCYSGEKHKMSEVYAYTYCRKCEESTFAKPYYLPSPDQLGVDEDLGEHGMFCYRCANPVESDMKYACQLAVEQMQSECGLPYHDAGKVDWHELMSYLEDLDNQGVLDYV